MAGRSTQYKSVNLFSKFNPALRTAQQSTMLPNLIIIGAMKSGTTSLHYYLRQHPQILMSKPKELRFFLSEENWHKGVDWYQSHFRRPAMIRGESTPYYTNYPRYKGVPERMHRLVPDAKLIYLIRHPIERIISEYVHHFASGAENRPLIDLLASLDDNPFLWQSKYYMQLSRYLRYYKRSQILIVTSEDLLRNRRATLQSIFRFLEVDDSFDSPRFSLIRYPTSVRRRNNFVGLCLSRVFSLVPLNRLSPSVAWRLENLCCLPFSRPVDKPVLQDDLRRELTMRLANDLNELEEFAGRRFDEWSLN